MKLLLSVIVVATLAYSGWWFYAAHNLRSSIENWFSAQRTKGWNATYSDISVIGFPSRTDLTLTDPRLIAPDGRIGWEAPFFQILGLSYKKGHVIVAWPNSQTLVTPGGNVAVTSEGLRASVIHDNRLLLRSNVEATTLNLTGSDHALALAGLTAALEKVDPSDARYRIALSAQNIAASTPDLSVSGLPDSLASLRADITLDLDNPLTLDDMTSAPIHPTSVSARHVEITYGALTLNLTGQVDIDPLGRATGDVTLQADNWREILETARTNGDLPAAVSDAVIDMLSMLATFGGSREALDITLGLQNGRILLGPLPIGTLPPIPWQ